MIDQAQADKVLQEADLLHDSNEINQVLDKMASRLNDIYADKDPIVFCVMNGGIVLAGMLLPKLTFSFRFDYLHATRYREQVSGAELHWLKRNDIDINERNVLVIDDILDEGHTLAAIVEDLLKQHPADIKTAVLAEKKHDRSNGFKADITGLGLVDRYVFGMGMDYKGYLRHLDAIYAVKGL